MTRWSRPDFKRIRTKGFEQKKTKGTKEKQLKRYGLILKVKTIYLVRILRFLRYLLFQKWNRRHPLNPMSNGQLANGNVLVLSFQLSGSQNPDTKEHQAGHNQPG